MGVNKNKLIFTIVLFVAASSGAVTSFTYAFFSANVITNNTLNISAAFDSTGAPLFLGYSDKDINLNVTQASMLESEKGSPAAIATANITAELTPGGSQMPVTCTYDLQFSASSEEYDTYIPSSGVVDNNLKEFTIKVERGTSTLYEETQISSISNNSNIVENESISSTGTNTVTKVYRLTATIYNLNTEQSIYNKNYKITLKIVNPICTGDSDE